MGNSIMNQIDNIANEMVAVRKKNMSAREYKTLTDSYIRFAQLSIRQLNTEELKQVAQSITTFLNDELRSIEDKLNECLEKGSYKSHHNWGVAFDKLIRLHEDWRQTSTDLKHN